MKLAGRGKVCLFNLQFEEEKAIQRFAAEQMFIDLKLDVPPKKTAMNYDMPLVPVQEDFFFFPFRLISKTIVGAESYKCTDFSEGSVLKNSVPKLSGVPAFLNHEQRVGREVGVIGQTKWDNGGYTHEQTAKKVPPGINGPYVIDGKLYPDLVRKLSAPISPIQASSVSPIFEWEASHEFENEGDFFWHLGEIIDEEMVRRIVKEIVSYEESSMVWMGADPYASILDDDGKVVNIDKSSAFARNKFSKDKNLSKYDSGKRYYVFDSLNPEKFLHLSKSSEKPKPENFIMDEEVLALLATMFGTTADKIKAKEFKKADLEKFIAKPITEFNTIKANSENFERVQTELAAEKKKVTDLTAEVGQLKTEKSTLETEKTTAAPLVKIANDVLTASRDEAKRMYVIFSKGKPEKAIEDELAAETDLSKLDAKIKMFGGKAITEFGASCSKCGSTEVNFRSSKPKEKEHQAEPFNMAEALRAGLV